jgi:hypothetical protein
MKIRDIEQAAVIKYDLDKADAIVVPEDAITGVTTSVDGTTREAILEWWQDSGRAEIVESVKVYIKRKRAGLLRRLASLDVELGVEVQAIEAAEAEAKAPKSGQAIITEIPE